MHEKMEDHLASESAFKRYNIPERKKDIQDKFETFFNSMGCKVEKSVPLLSNETDPTVIFIGSSTNVFKKYLKDGESVPENGVVLWQNKLRTKYYELLLEDVNLEYCSYFSGGGLLMPPGTYEKTCDLIVDFLASGLGIAKNDLSVRISSQDGDMIDHWKSKEEGGVRLEIDENDESEYRWKFGETDMTGRGLVFSVKGPDSSKFSDFGTLEIIEKDGKEVCIEWGFGTEVLLCGRLGMNHVLEALTISGIFPEASEEKNIKLADSITASLAILDEGVSIDKKEGGKASTILRRFLQGVVYCSRENEVSSTQIKKWSDYLCQNDFSKTPGIVDTLINFVERARKRESQFTTAITKAINGDMREITKMSGVKELLSKGKMINIFKLAEAYAFIGFRKSSFYKQIIPNLDGEGNLIIPEIIK